MASDELQEEIDDPYLLKEQLVAELSAARIDLQRARTRVTHQLNVKQKAKRYVADNRGAIISASIPLAGLMVWKTFFRKKKKKVQKAAVQKETMLKTVAGLAFAMVIKPYLRKLLMARAKTYLKQRFSNEPATRDQALR